MATTKCKDIIKSGTYDKNLRKVIFGNNWILTIQVHVCEETNKLLVDYEVTTSKQMQPMHYGIHNDEKFYALGKTLVLKMLTENFNTCKFIGGVNGNFVTLDFGDHVKSIMLPELEEDKVSHLKDLVLQQQEDIGKLKTQVGGLEQQIANLKVEIAGFKTESKLTKANLMKKIRKNKNIQVRMYSEEQMNAKKVKKADVNVTIEDNLQMRVNNPQYINLNIINESGEKVFFKIQKTAKLKRLIEVYCQRQSVRSIDVRFLYNGERILDTQTPNDLDMQEGDEIDVIKEQIG